jgi:hypothetical protein
MRNRSTQNNNTLASRASTKKAMMAAERSSAVKQASRIDNSNLQAQKRTSLSKKDEISRPNPKTKVTQNSKAASDVYRSSKPVNNKSKNFTERIHQKEVQSAANKTRTSNKDVAFNSNKPIYTKKVSERKNVASESRSKPAAKPKVNNTKQGSYGSMSDNSKSYQSKSRSATSNQRSYASTSRSQQQQTASENDSNYEKSKSKTRGN